MEFDKPRPSYLKTINQTGKLLDKICFFLLLFHTLTFTVT